MKVDKISSFSMVNRQNFCSGRLPYIRNNHIVDTFSAMENKFIDAETDLIRALSKRHPELHKALKQRVIPSYDVPLLKTLLINPVFEDEVILKEIPHMLSVKWPRENANRMCAQGRKNLADIFAQNSALYQNSVLRSRIGEIIANCRSMESYELTDKFLNKILDNALLSENESLGKKLPDLIVKLQDGLYEAKVDTKGIGKGYEYVLDKYISSDRIYKNENISSKLGDLLSGVSDYESAVKIGKLMEKI